MKAEDVTDTLELALKASGRDRATVIHKPRLLSDNGSSYIADDLAKWLDDRDMEHIRGAPYHPQTQGKIERWHQTLKNRILLENYYLPGDFGDTDRGLRRPLQFNHRYHESLGNLTPADVYFGRGQTILLKREKIKQKTLQTRRLQYAKPPHKMTNQMGRVPSLKSGRSSVPNYLTTDSWFKSNRPQPIETPVNITVFWDFYWLRQI